MASPRPIVVVASDPHWRADFIRLGAPIRRELGPGPMRIDHIGSTSVPGLDAKPVIDIQISVPALEPCQGYVEALARLGYEYRPENPDVSKRFFRGGSETLGVHIHVRRAGSFDEQLNLLFRDYLRTHPDVARQYAAMKWKLAEQFRNDREGYVNAKEPTVWVILRAAHTWAQETGWAAGPSDV